MWSKILISLWLSDHFLSFTAYMLTKLCFIILPDKLTISMQLCFPLPLQLFIASLTVIFYNYTAFISKSTALNLCIQLVIRVSIAASYPYRFFRFNIWKLRIPIEKFAYSN